MAQRDIQRDLLGQLEQELAKEASGDANKIIDLLTKLDAASRLPKPKRKSYLERKGWLVFSLAALIVTSVLWVTPYWKNPFSATIETERISFVVTNDTTLLPVASAGDFRAQGLSELAVPGLAREVGDDKKTHSLVAAATEPDFINIHGITVPAGSTVSVAISDGRLLVDVLGGIASGTIAVPATGRLLIDHSPIGLNALEPIPESVIFHGSTEPAVLALSLTTFLTAPVEIVEPIAVSKMAALHPSDGSGLYSSAIVGGNIKMLQTGETEQLRRSSQLQIDGNGVMEIAIGESQQLLVNYSGTGSRIANSIAGYRNELGISVLEAIVRDQKLLTFWSCVVFIFGSLKGVRQLLLSGE